MSGTEHVAKASQDEMWWITHKQKKWAEMDKLFSNTVNKDLANRHQNIRESKNNLKELEYVFW